MGRPLSVLFVEDSVEDAFLTNRALEKSGFDVRSKRVDTPSGMEAALSEGVWDIILCDYRMPRFSAPEALSILKASGVDIPFIVVSGVAGEDFAIEMMKSGASDYVKKDNLARLGPAVERELKEAENRREQRETENLIKNILEAVDEAFIVVGPDFRVISANRAYASQAGIDINEIKGRHCYDVSHGNDRPCFEAGEDCSVRHTFITGEPFTLLHTHHSKDGTPLYVETKSFPLKDQSGRVTSVIEIINDITEKRKLEDQLRQSQKMEAIGTLTGGVAHDFNNILTAIRGYGEIMKEEMASDDPVRNYLDIILVSAGKAAKLVQQLLVFSRDQKLDQKPVDLNDIIARAEGLLSRLISEDIELIIKPDMRGLTVTADSGQIEQALMNLVTNARDAMPHGGRLTISTGIVALDKAFVCAAGHGNPGRHAFISVSDTGIGMDEKTRERIFEPFFTTKPPGRGTGLGLSTVYGIIRQHYGFINVYSEPGKGTTFKIYLPMTETEEAGAEAEEPLPEAAGGIEKILIAEDNESIRSLLRTLLKKAGYTVIEAVDGEDAIRVFTEAGGDVDMLLLDVVMPKKTGRDAYDAIKKSAPDIKALFMSGYSFDIVGAKGGIDSGLDFISKPVSRRDLLGKIREILDREQVSENHEIREES